MSEVGWDVVIKAKPKFFDAKIREVFRYHYLLWLFVKRDVVTIYKQTILGPLWYIIQPVLTTIMFTVVFSRIANISTDGLPSTLFYFLGVMIWSYFSESLSKTSNVFTMNQDIFGKIYFPRVIVPASIVISNLGKFIIQFFVFLCIWIYYFSNGYIQPNVYALLLPVVIVILAIGSLGLGMIFSSVTTKYRDLSFMLSFGVQLWMYASPVIYPLSSIPVQYASLVKYNPISPLIEAMRYGFLGKGDFSLGGILLSLVFSLATLLIGFLVFSRVEKSFMDSV
jgi:lipopolysaccharide transport system permease protein